MPSSRPRPAARPSAVKKVPLRHLLKRNSNGWSKEMMHGTFLVCRSGIYKAEQSKAEVNMKVKLIKWLLAGTCGLLAACAIITVNVYFPAEDAKEAYKSLDGMLLKNSEEKAPEGDKPVPELKTPQAGPQSRLFDKIPS